jgi:hypothetical protein
MHDVSGRRSSKKGEQRTVARNGAEGESPTA